jgi:hypothetical protein
MQTFSALRVADTPPNGKELSRLITAAVVNRSFCNLLLANPATALAAGYNGEPFHLATEEQEFVLSIRATSLIDFAKQLTQNGNGNGHGYDHSHNGHGHNGHNGRNGQVHGKVREHP